MYRCDHCGKGFEQISEQHRPKNSHMFRCPACGKITFLASGLAQKKDPVQLTLHSLPAFFKHWLAQRVVRYLEDNPWVQIDVECSEEVIEMSPDQLTLAVRYGVGSWPEVLLEKLFPQQTDVMGLYLVCQPVQFANQDLKDFWDFLLAQAAFSKY